VIFARNRLVIVTKPGNPERVRALSDLARVDVVSLCGLEVPCGRYAAEIMREAQVDLREDQVTRGQDAKATLGAVTTGDADAAIVYVTDAKAAGDAVTTVAIPDAENAVAAYPIAVLERAGNRTTTRAFVDFVLSRAGQAVLRSDGFLPPE
jgi:molybdate transport system substrate-binding protein